MQNWVRIWNQHITVNRKSWFSFIWPQTWWRALEIKNALWQTPCLPYAFVLRNLRVKNIQEKKDQNYLAHGFHQRQGTTSGALLSPCIHVALKQNGSYSNTTNLKEFWVGEIGDWESWWHFSKKKRKLEAFSELFFHKNANDARAAVLDIHNGNTGINLKQCIIKIWGPRGFKNYSVLV